MATASNNSVPPDSSLSDTMKTVADEITQSLELDDNENKDDIVNDLLENGRQSLAKYEDFIIQGIYKDAMSGSNNKLMTLLKKYHRQKWDTYYGASDRWFITFIEEYRQGESYDTYERVLNRVAEYGGKYMNKCCMLSLILQLLFETIDDKDWTEAKLFDDQYLKHDMMPNQTSQAANFIDDQILEKLGVCDRLWFSVTNDGLQSLEKYSDFIVPDIMQQQLNENQSILFQVLRQYFKSELFSLLKRNNIPDRQQCYEIALNNVAKVGWLTGIKAIESKVTPKSYRNILDELTMLLTRRKLAIAKALQDQDNNPAQNNVERESKVDRLGIFINGLPFNMSEQYIFNSLHKAFSSVGQIKMNDQTQNLEITVCRRANKQLIGTATIKFVKEESVTKAIEAYNRKPIPFLTNGNVRVEQLKIKAKQRCTESTVESVTKQISGSGIGPVPIPPTVASNPSGPVCIFWDIENVAIPKGQNAFDIVMKIRKQLIVDRNLTEGSFTVFCDANKLPSSHRRFREEHRSRATAVLISGDIDYIKFINELRFRCRHHIIVIYKPPVNDALIATANEAYCWDEFIGINGDPSMRPPNENESSKLPANPSKQKTVPKTPNPYPPGVPQNQRSPTMSNRSLSKNRHKNIKLETIELSKAKDHFLKYFDKKILDDIRKKPGIRTVDLMDGKMQLSGDTKAIALAKSEMEQRLYEQSITIAQSMQIYLTRASKGLLWNKFVTKYNLGFSFQLVTTTASTTAREMRTKNTGSDRSIETDTNKEDSGHTVDQSDDEEDEDDNINTLPESLMTIENSKHFWNPSQRFFEVTFCTDSENSLSRAKQELQSYTLCTKSWALTQAEKAYILRQPQNIISSQSNNNIPDQCRRIAYYLTQYIGVTIKDKMLFDKLDEQQAATRQ